MKIAVLGWGSLIWDPRELRIRDGWLSTGPVIPIEFSRVSEDGRLTLVIDENNGVPIQVLYAISACATLSEARQNLMAREKVLSLNPIGFVDVAAGMTSDRAKEKHPGALKIISKWTEESAFDATIWTALEPQFQKRTSEPFSEPAALRHVQRLPPAIRPHAFTYITKAPLVVKTPFRDLFRRQQHAERAARYRNSGFGC